MMALTVHSTTSFLSPADTTKAVNKATDEFPVSTVPFQASRPPACRQQRTRATGHDVLERVSQALVERKEGVERLHGMAGLPGHGGGTARVPVYVMLPLDTVAGNGAGLNKGRALNASLMALRSAGVEGVMVDVWWGIVERDGPLKYNWEGYAQLLEMVKRNGLKLQMVMSFHQCGGNVGDSCSIPLPPWVHDEMSRDKDLVYTDRSGRRNPEYISLGCDMIPVLKGRTPIQVYSDYMRSFRERFTDYLNASNQELFLAPSLPRRRSSIRSASSFRADSLPNMNPYQKEIAEKTPAVARVWSSEIFFSIAIAALKRSRPNS